ncbi:GNAT family N-acetyltransferase [Nonomuraea rhizosphaerae]|uniref:GNAT family N-acetyltransferase n=1 Tax=Nonomuraea rhizosphaerae TaxID=2665663 RepID=UPI001C5DBCEF|nr:GNAT family N-acyltransferase [Nonomuraea rhizosphaerae]
MTISLDTGRHTVGLAVGPRDVQAAQRLRHEVFSGEMGARLDSPVSGLDVDRFDAYCDHLVVREGREVVATCRLLPAGRTDRLLSDGAFELGALAGIRKGLVEGGRMCVHRDRRDGAVVALLWAGIARYLLSGGHEWLAGRCPVPLGDGGVAANGVVKRVGLGPQEYRVTPRRPWRGGRKAVGGGRFVPPALLRGFLRMGAWVCGAPAHDPDAGAADFFMLLPVGDVSPRHLRRLG